MDGILRAYIIHSFAECGGAVRVSLETARALSMAGYPVVYITDSVECMHKCSMLLDLPANYPAIECSSLVSRVISSTGRFIRFKRLAMIKSMLNVARKLDGLIIDTYTDALPSVDIAYVNFPLVVDILARHYTTSRSWIKIPYELLLETTARKLTGKPGVVLTNSTWTAQLIKQYFGIKPTVLYPPVDVDYFAYRGNPKEKVIVTISRFTPEKNLHLLPLVGSELPDYDWYIVGSAFSSVSNLVIAKIVEEKKKWRARNVHLVVNPPKSEVKRLLEIASFYVHPLYPEHFGISVVEAMAAGAIPIVYKHGGAWTDIVSRLSPELGYLDVHEVPLIIRSIERSQSLEKLRIEAIKQAQNFSSQVFRNRFVQILNEYVSRFKQ